MTLNDELTANYKGPQDNSIPESMLSAVGSILKLQISYSNYAIGHCLCELSYCFMSMPRLLAQHLRSRSQVHAKVTTLRL